VSGPETLIAEAVDFFRDRFGMEPALAAAAPGRSNLIGEHTDYNEGHVLPIAIDRYIVAAVSNRTDSRFRLFAADLDDYFEFDGLKLPEGRPLWVSYVGGVIVEMMRDGISVSGKDMVIHGDVPIGSGLSSSAALEVSTATAVERLEGLELTDGRMVNICRRADHRFVGVKCGPMDQFASRACRAGHAGLLDCRTLEMEHHPLTAGIDYFSIFSGIPRALVASEYNERQASCEEAVKVIAEGHPEVKALRDATPGMVEERRKALGERVYRRARHVVGEQERVFELIAAMQRGDLRCIGEVLLAGHRSLSEDYEVSLPVLDEMIDWLYGRSGAIGARLTGAGFGGSMIFLAEAGRLDPEELSAAFADGFRAKVKDAPAVWLLASVDGARFQPAWQRGG
jgi:galactokinase